VLSVHNPAMLCGRADHLVTQHSTAMQAAVNAAPGQIQPLSKGTAPVAYCSKVANCATSSPSSCNSNGTSPYTNSSERRADDATLAVRIVASFLALTAACACCAWLTARHALVMRRRSMPIELPHQSDVTLVRTPPCMGNACLPLSLETRLFYLLSASL
jgi:hypothetical protein